MIGVPLPDLQPGSSQWLKVMSASKVGAMLGLSPFESRYSLWQRMAGRIPPEPNNDLFRRGHYLEPAIAAWFADEHPELHVAKSPAFAHPDRPWQTASPDRLLFPRTRTGRSRRTPAALLECKSANNEWEWGQEGSDEVPPGYLAQVRYQLDTLGLDRAYVAVLMPYMEFREYVIEADAEDAAFIRAEAEAFMASVAAGEEPPLDDTEHTYQAIRQLNPGITDDEVDLDADTAAAYLDALIGYEEATAAKQAATNAVARAMGTARRAVYGTTTYATRQSRKRADGTPGTPYVVAGRGLTHKEKAA